jgi:hypothetical protein
MAIQLISNIFDNSHSPDLIINKNIKYSSALHIFFSFYKEGASHRNIVSKTPARGLTDISD